MYESYNDRKFIHLRQEKTDVDVYIPLSGKVQTIVARHGGKIPYMDRKKLIRNIRVCGQLLGWNEPVSVTVTKGSFSYDNNVPFYRMLKTHTAGAPSPPTPIGPKFPYLPSWPSRGMPPRRCCISISN